MSGVGGGTSQLQQACGKSSMTGLTHVDSQTLRQFVQADM